jgi:hypothetical protein
VRRSIARSITAVRLIAKDRRIPKPLRWLLALSLLPIPGPFDEAVLLLIAPLLAIFYREPMREAWRASGPTPPPAGDR